MTSTFAQRLLGAAALGAALLTTATPAAAGWVLTEFSRPGATTTQLWDVNNSGQMVGYTLDAAGAAQAYLYSGGSFTTLLGPDGAATSNALGISDGGVIVGSWSGTVGGPSRGFIYSGGSYTMFDAPGANETFLRAISPDGRYISGYYSTDTAAGVGFVYDRLAGTSQIVSTAASLFTIAQGINSSYTLVGSDTVSTVPTTRPGFFFDIATGIRTDVSIAGAVSTRLRAIADDDTVGGWFIDGAGLTHGFVGSVSSFTQLDFAGADGTFVEGINNAGVLVGNFLVGDVSGAFIAVQVPAPAGWALVMLGLIALPVARAARPATLRAPRPR